MRRRERRKGAARKRERAALALEAAEGRAGQEAEGAQEAKAAPEWPAAEPAGKPRRARGKRRRRGKAGKVKNAGGRKARRSSARAAAAACLAIAAAALAVAVAGLGRYFEDHFYVGASVGGVDVSGLSEEAACRRIARKADRLVIAVREDGGRTEYVSPDDVGFSLSGAKEAVAGAMKEQRAGDGWIASLGRAHGYEATLASYDEDLVYQEAVWLDCCMNPDAREPEDATYRYEDGRYVVVPEEEGTAVDLPRLVAEIGRHLERLDGSLDMRAEHCYEEPSVTRSTPELVEMVGTLNNCLGAEIAYEDRGTTVRPEEGEAAGWVSIGDGWTVELDDAGIRKFVRTCAAAFDTKGLPLLVEASDGAASVPAVSYGYEVDCAYEETAVKNALLSGEDLSRAPRYASAPPDGDAGRIEVNLTAQKASVIGADGQAAWTGAVVTGSPGSGQATPVGAYSLEEWADGDGTIRLEGGPVLDGSGSGRMGGVIYRYSGTDGRVLLPPEGLAAAKEALAAGAPAYLYQMPGTEDASLEEGEAAPVIAAIAAIGDPEPGGSAALSAARAAYDALPADARPYVTNYAALAAAEERLAFLEGEAAAAADLSARLESLSWDDDAAVDAAWAAYGALSDWGQARVSGADRLVAAEESLARRRQEEEERARAEEEARKRAEEEEEAERAREASESRSRSASGPESGREAAEGDEEDGSKSESKSKSKSGSESRPGGGEDSDG